MKPKIFTLSSNTIVLLLCVYFTTLFNIGFWQKTFHLAAGDTVLLATMPLFLLAAMNLCMQILFWPRLHRLMMPLLLVLGSAVSYAVMVQGIYFNADQLQNVLQTDPTEASSWISVKFIVWVLLTGVIPAVLYVLCIRTQKTTWYRALGKRLLSVLASLAVVGVLAATSYQHYASFFRNNKSIPHQIVPTNFLGAAFKTAYNAYDASRPFEKIGEDARRLKPQGERKKLLVLVVGETTRAENWGLNPNAPATTPQLAQTEGVINYPNVSSCGTATAVSVPCMFSRMNRSDYNANTAKHQENLMDMLKRAGIYTSWKDNDSGSKGVADRIKYVDVYKTIHDAAARCKGDLCYDTALLDGLKEEIQAMPNDGVIVLHTVGSHGPTYFERYPPHLRKFTPTCDTSQIQDCSREQLLNTYNNTILAVDDMLTQTIHLLQSETNTDAALWYLSDHGESLGENGLYLHATPYAVAPSQQTHIPMIFWANKGFYQNTGLNENCLKQHAGDAYSQDNLFHSVLGLMDIGTKEYHREQDMFAACRK